MSEPFPTDLSHFPHNLTVSQILEPFIIIIIIIIIMNTDA